MASGDLRLRDVLANLQAYRLATGQVATRELGAVAGKEAMKDEEIYGRFVVEADRTRQSSERFYARPDKQALPQPIMNPYRSKRRDNLQQQNTEAHEKEKHSFQRKRISEDGNPTKSKRRKGAPTVIGISKNESLDGISSTGHLFGYSVYSPSISSSSLSSTSSSSSSSSSSSTLAAAAPSFSDPSSSPMNDSNSSIAAKAGSSSELKVTKNGNKNNKAGTVDFFSGSLEALNAAYGSSSSSENEDDGPENPSGAQAVNKNSIENSNHLIQKSLLAGSKKHSKRPLPPLAPETIAPEWDPMRNHFKQAVTRTSTRKCWKCGRSGHLSEHCATFANVPTPSISDPTLLTLPRNFKEKIYSPLLREFHHRCENIRKDKSRRCAVCGINSNLATCLDCDVSFCDGRGHLTAHLKDQREHRMLYSHKLQRQVKCATPDCEVMDLYQLKTCETCLDRYFSRFYSMATCTWSKEGLKCVPSAITCEDHFQWHLMNCPQHAKDEYFLSDEKLRRLGGQLSEYFF